MPGPVLGPKSHQRSVRGVCFLLEEADKTHKHTYGMCQVLVPVRSVQQVRGQGQMCERF